MAGCSVAPERVIADRRHLPGHPEGSVEPGTHHKDCAAQRAVAAVLTGALRPAGSLPVTVTS